MNDEIRAQALAGDLPVEEITVGLPSGEAPVVAHETPDLAADLHDLEKQLLVAHSLEDLLLFATLGVKRSAGATRVELVLHDPVNELRERVIHHERLAAHVVLTPDSSRLEELYEGRLSPRQLDPMSALNLGIFKGEHGLSDVLIIPVMEGGMLVGSLHIADAQRLKGASSDDIRPVSRFVEKLPLMIANKGDLQRALDLMVLDPVTRMANEQGLFNDLRREVVRASRAHRAVCLIALRLNGMSALCNLSQRHVRDQVIRHVATLLSAQLRSSDHIGRLGTDGFGITVVEADSQQAEKIAQRFQQQLADILVDDGMGGSIDTLTTAGYVSVLPEHLTVDNVDEVTQAMLDEADDHALTAYHQEIICLGGALSYGREARE